MRGAVKRLGVRYPVALDNQYGTWNAYGNQYWPAEYLIDKHGHIRRAHFRLCRAERDLGAFVGDPGADDRRPRLVPDLFEHQAAL